MPGTTLAVHLRVTSMMWAIARKDEVVDCTADVNAIDFAPSASTAPGLLGTADAWEGGVAASLVAPSTQVLDAVRASLARHASEALAALQRGR